MLTQLLAVGGLWQILLGITLLFDPGGYTSTSYAVMFAIVPEPAHGVAFLISGIASVIAIRRPHAVPLVLASATVLSVIWALGFVAAGFTGELSGWSGPITWSAVAAFWAATLYREAPGQEV